MPPTIQYVRLMAGLIQEGNRLAENLSAAIVVSDMRSRLRAGPEGQKIADGSGSYLDGCPCPYLCPYPYPYPYLYP